AARRRGRGTPGGPGADAALAGQRAHQRRADRDRRLQLLTGGLIALPLDGLLRAAQLLLERRLPRRVFAPEHLERAVPLFARRLVQPSAEIALRFVRRRDGAARRPLE